MTELLSPALLHHLPVLPVVLPMLTAALLLALGDQRRLPLQRTIALLALLLAGSVIGLLLNQAASGTAIAYQLGNWPAPFGIVLVVDRLSAFMLGLTWLVALPVLWYAISSGWDTRGRYFHAMFQLQLMGLHGAFLTGDLFNLFVFFEILLIASYVLLLHGQGANRLRVGLHYVVLNLGGSAIFLIGLALVYGLTGTLNMADVALRAAELAHHSASQAMLLKITALLLLVVFSLKAAIVPLQLWLPNTYATASAPVAALFAIMTKVGVYSILRTHVMVFGPFAGEAFAAQNLLLPLGALTSVAGVLGALAAHRLARLVAWLTVASVGTILIGVGLYTPAGLSAALYYTLHSTLVMAAMFLLVEVVALQRGTAYDRLQPANKVAQPMMLGLLVLLGSASAAGLPPLPGFLGKIMLLQSSVQHALHGWLWAVILGVGFLTLIGLARAGALLFWNVTSASPAPHPPAPATAATLLPGIWLLGAVLLAAVYASPIKHYTDALAQQIYNVPAYAEQVLGPQQAHGISRSTRPYTGQLPTPAGGNPP